MNRGPAMVIPGSILGSTFLVLFLLFVTSGASSPVISASNDTFSNRSQNILESENITEQSNFNNSNLGCSINPAFPPQIFQWCSLITHYANKNGLDPNLVAALIWQESNGNPAAYSKSGAVGLMQIMPNDGLAASFICVNGPCFANRPSTKKLKDPEFNISYGTRMLARLLKKNGNIRDALKAYGPMNVGYYYADKVLGIRKNYQD